MAPTIVSSYLVPLRGDRADSAIETAPRRQPKAGPGLFAAGEQADQRPAAPAPRGNRIGGDVAVADSLPLLRRRTDRGEAADPEIRIPPHLERRRAWREAFGLNTWHTQQLAQADSADEPATDAARAAIRAYRATAWRGRLDLDLAQRVSVTV